MPKSKRCSDQHRQATLLFEFIQQATEAGGVFVTEDQQLEWALPHRQMNPKRLGKDELAEVLKILRADIVASDWIYEAPPGCWRLREFCTKVRSTEVEPEAPSAKAVVSQAGTKKLSARVNGSNGKSRPTSHGFDQDLVEQVAVEIDRVTRSSHYYRRTLDSAGIARRLRRSPQSTHSGVEPVPGEDFDYLVETAVDYLIEEGSHVKDTDGTIRRKHRAA